MRIIVSLILGLLSFALGATGIGPPAGMGTLLLMMAAGVVLLVLLISWVLWKFYKRARNKIRYFLWVFGLAVFTFVLWLVGVRIDAYQFIDNNPLEASLTVVNNKDGYYLELSDGQWYKYVDKYHKNPVALVAARTAAGQDIMLEPHGSSQQLTVYSKGQTHAYYWDRREQAEALISIPLKFNKQDMYQKAYEGRVVPLAKDWQAEPRDLSRALTKNDCCDVPWLEELLRRGANRDDVINREQLLHRFFDHTDRANRLQYRTVVTQLLLDAGADINAIQDYSGTSVLHKVVKELPGIRRQGFSAEDEAFLQLLLDQGADPDVAYSYGATTLELAVRNQQYEVAMLLLRSGANPHRRPDEYGTAYELALQALNRQQKKIDPTPNPLLLQLVAMMTPEQ